MSVEDVVHALREPTLCVAPGISEAASGHCQMLVPRLRLLSTQRNNCAARIEKLLAELDTTSCKHAAEQSFSDVARLCSLSGVGRIVAATILPKASTLLVQRNYLGLRAQAGVAPVTKQSGKRLTVTMRRGCNLRLRNALYHWARTSTQYDSRES